MKTIMTITNKEIHQIYSRSYTITESRGKERQQRPEKYFWFEHAERNAIYNAARIGVSLRDTTMYLTCGVPCSDCARGIISSGIKRIYCKSEDTTKNRQHWDEHAKRSVQMFEESSVEVIFYD